MRRHSGLYCDSGAERKTCEPERIGRMPCTHPCNRRQRVIQFAIARVVFAIAVFGTSKIKAQSLIPGAHERPHQGVDNLVMHGPAMLRVRMTNDRTTLERTLTRTLNNGLKTTDGAVDE